MMTQNLPPAVASINMRALFKDYREFAVSRDHADALAVERHRDAQGLDDAEIAHSAFACLDVECRRDECVDLQRRILAAHPAGFRVVS